MNVIFLDFDGVLDTISYNSNEDIENKIKILSDICKKYDCKVVIEASAKDSIDEETMETESEWVGFILKMFDKYGIECIGKTPNVVKKSKTGGKLSMWKEDEIIKYLLDHPEIDHFCVIDDDDTLTMLHWPDSDLDKVREHLVTTIMYSEIPGEEGLLERHSDEVGRILKKENKYKSLALKRKNNVSK